MNATNISRKGRRRKNVKRTTENTGHMSGSALKRERGKRHTRKNTAVFETDMSSFIVMFDGGDYYDGNERREQ